MASQTDIQAALRALSSGLAIPQSDIQAALRTIIARRSMMRPQQAALQAQAMAVGRRVAAPLIRAGLPARIIEQQVRTAVQPIESARKALLTAGRTGVVPPEAQRAIRQAQTVFPNLSRQVSRAAAAPVVRAASDIVKSVPPSLRGPAQALVDSALRGKLDPQAVQRLGEREAKKVLNQYATKYGKAALNKLTPPGVKLPGGIDVGGAVNMILSGKVTTEGAKELVYDSTKGTAEKWMQGVTGLPITLPKDFTLKSIAGSLTSLIPTDLQGVLDKGLLVASQAVSGVLTTALAGSAIGSVIPGLGTVVGIGVALGVEALKGALKTKPPPYAQKCPTKVTCPKVPNLSPLELLPWIATEQVAVYQAVAKDRQKSYCGAGASVECTYRMSTLTERVAEILNPSGVKANVLTAGRAADATKSAAYTLGLPQLRKLIPLYERAPKSRPWYDTKAKIVVQSPNVELMRVLSQLKARKMLLDAFVARKNSIPRMTSQEAETFRYDVWDKLQNAIYQAALAPGRDTQDWLKTVGEMWTMLVRRQDELRAVSQKRITGAQSRRAELAKKPGWKPKQYVVS
jgi:hypothetical protein